MAKGFGIAALVLAIVAIFIPFGVVITLIAVVCATVAALAGDRGFAIATSVIGFVNAFFMSPTTWIWLGSSSASGNTLIKVILALIIALPVAGIILNATGKLALQKQ